MDPLNPLDPLDLYQWQEVFDPEMKYECQNCGTLFGDEEVHADPELDCLVAVFPVCGATWRVELDR